MNWKVLILSLGTILLWGIGAFLAKIASKNGTGIQTYLAEYFGTVLVGFLFMVLFQRTAVSSLVTNHDWHLLAPGIAMGICWGIATIMYMVANAAERTSIITPLTSMYPLITVILVFISSWLYPKLIQEKLKTNEIFGIIFALVSILCFTLSEKLSLRIQEFIKSWIFYLKS